MASLLRVDGYLPIFLLLAIGFVAVAAVLLVTKLIRPHKPNDAKTLPYECGEEPMGDAWIMFNPRFYIIALIFLVFEIESILMFPVLASFKSFNQLGLGGLILVEILCFIVILLAAFAYCWKKGDLDWVRSFQVKKDEQ